MPQRSAQSVLRALKGATLCLVCAGCLGSVGRLLAQESAGRTADSPSDTVRTVTGRVRAAETGEPLENVLVELVGQGLQALTDARGRFRIEGAAPKLDTLVASFLNISEARQALDLVSSGRRHVEIELSTAVAEAQRDAEAPPDSVDDGAAGRGHPAAGGRIDCASATWRVDLWNRSDRAIEVYPWVGSDPAELAGLLRQGSDGDETAARGELITVLGVRDRRSLALRARRPVLLFFASTASRASGISDRHIVGWASPEGSEFVRIRGVRISFLCEDS